MRMRNIKPGLLKNEILGSAPIEVQFLFGVLPMLADRAGILEDRPLRIRAEVFPYRSEINVDGLLNLLVEGEFISRYDWQGTKLIHITTFTKHQHPHKDEPASNYLTPIEVIAKSREAQGMPGHMQGISRVQRGSHDGDPALILDTHHSDLGTSYPTSSNTQSLTSASRGESPDESGEEVETPMGLSPSGSKGSESPDRDGVVPEETTEKLSPPRKVSTDGGSKPTPRAAQAKGETILPLEVEKIATAWSEICKIEGSPFKGINSAQLARHTPSIIENLKDPRWLPWCLEVIQWLPSSDFNAGRIPPREEGKDPFVCAFGNLIKKVPLLHEDMIKDLNQKEQLAKARNKSNSLGSHQTGALLGNHLKRSQRSRKPDDSVLPARQPTIAEFRRMEEEHPLPPAEPLYPDIDDFEENS